jgi:hypothetical protein
LWIGFLRIDPRLPTRFSNDMHAAAAATFRSISATKVGCVMRPLAVVQMSEDLYAQS